MHLAYRCVISISILANISNAQTNPAIYGIWQNSQFGYQMTLILNQDGTGEFDGESIRFSATANTLRLEANGMATTYGYSLNKTTLNLSGGDLDSSIAFVKSGTEINTTGSSLVPGKATASDPALASSSNNNLIGVWSGNGESIEFKNTGECLYLGNVYKYHSTADRITLTTNQGDVAFGYAINGNQLTLVGNAGQAVYSKGNANSGTNATTKGVAMELVGKWCWINVTSTNSGGTQSSRCIVLNADGTYLYQSERSASVNTDAFYGGTNSQSSDQGTWYVQGDRIFYHSQTTGQGSYRLEKRNHPKNVNDPMIVLDGEAYVTATFRQPWR